MDRLLLRNCRGHNEEPNSITGKYLSGEIKIPVPKHVETKRFLKSSWSQGK